MCKLISKEFSDEIPNRLEVLFVWHRANRRTNTSFVPKNVFSLDKITRGENSNPDFGINKSCRWQPHSIWFFQGGKIMKTKMFGLLASFILSACASLPPAPPTAVRPTEDPMLVPIQTPVPMSSTCVQSLKDESVRMSKLVSCEGILVFLGKNRTIDFLKNGERIARLTYDRIFYDHVMLNLNDMLVGLQLGGGVPLEDRRVAFVADFKSEWDGALLFLPVGGGFTISYDFSSNSLVESGTLKVVAQLNGVSGTIKNVRLDECFGAQMSQGGFGETKLQHVDQSQREANFEGQLFANKVGDEIYVANEYWNEPVGLLLDVTEDMSNLRNTSATLWVTKEIKTCVEK